MAKSKYIAAVLTMLMLLASCGISPAEGGESSSPPPPAVSSVSTSDLTAEDAEKSSGIPAYYAAYQEIVTGYQGQYGIGTVQ